MANRPDALQSSRKSQCSSASVRTTWLYRPDPIQGLTSIRVYASRHSYGKTAATVRTMSSIRQERAYQVQPSGRQPSWSERSSFIYGNYVHQFNLPDVSLQGPDTPKPYYGNYIPSKCNRLDARVTPSGRSLIMEAFGAILKRRLHLTVWKKRSFRPDPILYLEVSMPACIRPDGSAACPDASQYSISF
jgi:hypothetical protein